MLLTATYQQWGGWPPALITLALACSQPPNWPHVVWSKTNRLAISETLTLAEIRGEKTQINGARTCPRCHQNSVLGWRDFRFKFQQIFRSPVGLERQNELAQHDFRSPWVISPVQHSSSWLFFIIYFTSTEFERMPPKKKPMMSSPIFTTITVNNNCLSVHLVLTIHVLFYCVLIKHSYFNLLSQRLH